MTRNPPTPGDAAAPGLTDTGLPAPLLVTLFSRGGIASVRLAVAQVAAEHGLPRPERQDFVLAANEIVTNAIAHGGGRGRLLLWAERGRLWCEVADHGPGMPREWIERDLLPPGSSGGGRGLWLTRRLCAEVSVVSGPGGTVVRFAAARRPG